MDGLDRLIGKIDILIGEDSKNVPCKGVFSAKNKLINRCQYQVTGGVAIQFKPEKGRKIQDLRIQIAFAQGEWIDVMLCLRQAKLALVKAVQKIESLSQKVE